MKRFLLYIGLLALMAVVVPSAAIAQEFVWNADFDFRFDNREYGDPSKMVAPSETIFGANITPEAGLGWGYGHNLMIGATLHADMGSQKFFDSPSFIAYYDFDDSRSRLRASLGLFPCSKLRGRFSRATFDDTYWFYNPTIEGAMLRYTSSYWWLEVACDWNGLRSHSRREMFTLLVSGEAKKSLSYAGYNLMLHHHAQSDTARGVVDNGLLNVYLGIDLSSLFMLTEFSFQASWLQGYQNDRYHIGEPVMPGGYELTLTMQRNHVGLVDTFYKGQDLMPYWNMPYEDANGAVYGSNLYSGDPFYRVGKSGYYNRLELYWEPKLNNGVSLRFSSVHHFDGVHWGWQQIIALRVDIGSEMFAPIR